MYGDKTNEKSWRYYEEGKEEIFARADLLEYFSSAPGLQEQKSQGTDFESWLSEMEHMQILIPEVEGNYGKFGIRNCR